MCDRADVALAALRDAGRSAAVLVEDDDAVLPLRLRGHHRRLGAGDQLARVHRVLGPERDADRQRDRAGLRRGARRAPPVSRAARPTASPATHDGRITANSSPPTPADRVGARGRSSGAPRAMNWRTSSPSRVAADVVDALEVVDVEHHQRDRVVRAAGAAELGAQPLVEVAVVVEAGQRVGVGQVLEARADLRVVEGERCGVAEPAGELELVLVERTRPRRRGRCSARPSASRGRSAAR